MYQTVTNQLEAFWNIKFPKLNSPQIIESIQSNSHSFVLCGLLVILQLLDAILTISGVYHFGIQAEGNPFLQLLMLHIGVAPSIILVKSAALIIIGVLYNLSFKVSWIPVALYGVIAVYTFAAIVPWSYILISYS